jgi:hypothetical protein
VPSIQKIDNNACDNASILLSINFLPTKHHFRGNHNMADNFPDAGAKAWIYKYAKKQYWRVAAWIEFDDLVQDGLVEYYEVRKRYPQAVEPSHIMSLLQLCFRSKIEDLVRANTKQLDDARSDIVEVYESPMMIVPDASNFNTLLAKAPKLISDVIALLTNDVYKEEISKPFERYQDGRRETLNDRVCKLLGLDAKKINAVQETKLYFSA